MGTSFHGWARMKPTDFAKHLTDYLTRYLPGQRNVSPNTVRSYRDAFLLLLRYLRDEKGLAPERVTLNNLDASLVLEWLEYLASRRRCSARTVNQRLAALHAFFRFLQVEEPNRILQAQRVLAIPSRRYERRPIKHLSEREIGALLAQPDTSTERGRRDAVLLSLLYDTGVRSQELLDLRVRDIRFEAPAHVRVVGKGRKVRFVPLMGGTVALLREYLRAGGMDRPECADVPLFRGRGERALSRSGLRYVLAKHANAARAHQPDVFVTARIGPHSVRHTKAIHLLEAGVHPIHIRDLFGHEDVRTTTGIYARASVEMKRRVLEQAALKSPQPADASLQSWRSDKDLLAWLRSL
jgi:site-specific recombinase XerD